MVCHLLNYIKNKYWNLMESFAFEYWPCAILKLSRERNIDFDLEESYYFWKWCCFLTHSCVIAEPQTVVIETEAEIGALERDLNLWEKYMWIHLHRAELWLHCEDLSNEVCSSIFFPEFLYKDCCILPSSWYIR